MKKDIGLSHINENEQPEMVDVSGKHVTNRMAKAEATVHVGSDIMNHLVENDFTTKKGGLIQTAIIAGNMAVKKTSDLIPLCHPLFIDGCKIEIQRDDTSFLIFCEVKTTGKTGVEMEALTGASVAALTVYDMLKALSHDISINSVRLLEKTGGKSDFKAIQ